MILDAVSVPRSRCRTVASRLPALSQRIPPRSTSTVGRTIVVEHDQALFVRVLAVNQLPAAATTGTSGLNSCHHHRSNRKTQQTLARIDELMRPPSAR